MPVSEDKGRFRPGFGRGLLGAFRALYSQPRRPISPDSVWSTTTPSPPPRNLESYDGNTSTNISRRASRSEGHADVNDASSGPRLPMPFRLHPASTREYARALLDVSNAGRKALQERKGPRPEMELLSTWLEHTRRAEQRTPRQRSSLKTEAPSPDLLLAAMVAAAASKGINALSIARPPEELIDFETIKYARLDKLLSEICATLQPHPVVSKADVEAAWQVLEAWHARFGPQFDRIDEMRCTELAVSGRPNLSSVVPSLAEGLRAANPNTWRMTGSWGELGSDGDFKSGHWWLDIACAQRDGVVGCTEERLTRGKYGTMTLPLLTGREEQMEQGRVKYTHQGERANMHADLTTLPGSHMRILRGCGLGSPYAPKAGVRFDGFWKIDCVSRKVNEATAGTAQVCTVSFTLEPASGQQHHVPMEELCNIPRPSQVDDAKLWEKMEVDWARRHAATSNNAREGGGLRREEYKTAQELWRSSLEARESVSCPPASTTSPFRLPPPPGSGLFATPAWQTAQKRETEQRQRKDWMALPGSNLAVDSSVEEAEQQQQQQQQQKKQQQQKRRDHEQYHRRYGDQISQTLHGLRGQLRPSSMSLSSPSGSRPQQQQQQQQQQQRLQQQIKNSVRLPKSRSSAVPKTAAAAGRHSDRP